MYTIVKNEESQEYLLEINADTGECFARTQQYKKITVPGNMECIVYDEVKSRKGTVEDVLNNLEKEAMGIPQLTTRLAVDTASINFKFNNGKYIGAETEIYVPEDKTEVYQDESKLKEAINKALISAGIQDEVKWSGENKGKHCVKYTELGKVTNGNSVDIYAWMEYGVTDAAKTESFSSSFPVKITISLETYKMTNCVIPDDDVDYSQLFPAVADKLDDIQFRMDTLQWSETYFEE